MSTMVFGSGVEPGEVGLDDERSHEDCPGCGHEWERLLFTEKIPTPNGTLVVITLVNDWCGAGIIAQEVSVTSRWQPGPAGRGASTI